MKNLVGNETFGFCKLEYPLKQAIPHGILNVNTTVSENVISKKRKAYATISKGMMGRIASTITNSMCRCIIKLVFVRPKFSGFISLALKKAF